MPRKYADLHVLLPPNEDALGQMADLLSGIGYDTIGLSLAPSTMKPNLRRYTTILRERDLDVSSRLDLEPRSRSELLSSLRRLRGRYEIIGVRCTNRAVSSIAARDSRVDLISFRIDFPEVRFDQTLAQICRCALEIDLSQIVASHRDHGIISRLTEEVSICMRHDIPIVVSSGASSPAMVRGPRDMASVLTFLGVQPAEALEAVSRVPLSIIEKNRMKLEKNRMKLQKDISTRTFVWRGD